MPAKKIYAQTPLDLGGGKVIKPGDVVATIDSDLPVEKVVNLLFAGQAAESVPVPAPAAEAKPAPEAKK